MTPTSKPVVGAPKVRVASVNGTKGWVSAISGRLGQNQVRLVKPTAVTHWSELYWRTSPAHNRPNVSAEPDPGTVPLAVAVQSSGVPDTEFISL